MSLYNEKLKTLAASLATYPPLPESVAASGADHQPVNGNDGAIYVSVDNPLCGDRIKLAAICQQGELHTLHGEVRGCLLCQAATAIALAAVKDAPLGASELQLIAAQWEVFLQQATGSDWLEVCEKAEIKQSAWQQLGLFSPLQVHQSRQACVRLIFTGLEAVFSKLGK